MLCRFTLPAALAATVAFGALPSLAAMAPQETTAELASFQHAKVSLQQAIATVQAETGGKVTSVVFETMPGRVGKEVSGQVEGYLVTFIANNAMNQTFVDPETGRATQTSAVATMQYNPERVGKAEFLDLEHAKTSLPQAIAKAEQQSGGKAIDAAVVKRSTGIDYKIGVVRDGRLSSLWIDPNSGQVASRG